MTALRVIEASRDEDSLVHDFVRGRVDGTRRIYMGEARIFLLWVNKAVNRFAANDLRAYIDMARRNSLKPATIHKKVVIVKAFTKFLVQEGELDADPFVRVETPPCPGETVPRGMSREQLKSFFAAMKGQSLAAYRDRAMFLLMAATGLRIGEARALSYGSVSEAEENGWKVLRVVGKGQKEREVHVSPAVWKSYVAYHERRREPWVDSTPLFAAIPKGKPIKAVAIDRRMSVSSIFSRFKRIAAKAGLPSETSPHALRHFFASESDATGASVEAIRIALGHSDLRVTTRYLARVRRGINPAFEKISLLQVICLFDKSSD